MKVDCESRQLLVLLGPGYGGGRDGGGHGCVCGCGHDRGARECGARGGNGVDAGAFSSGDDVHGHLHGRHPPQFPNSSPNSYRSSACNSFTIFTQNYSMSEKGTISVNYQLRERVQVEKNVSSL